MPRTPTTLLSPADQERRRALQRMKAVALGALIFMALAFVIAFALQQRIEWLAYVRAAAEGGMVGALADWFAVTALFRHPLGIPIPHTAIIPTRKDEIGRTLGEFVETNFLEASVVRTKLASTPIARRAGEWLTQPAHAERVGSAGGVGRFGQPVADSPADTPPRSRSPMISRDMKLPSTNWPSDRPIWSLRSGMIAVCGIGNPSGWRNRAVTANQSASAPTIAASAPAST